MTERPERLSLSVTEDFKQTIRVSAAENGLTMSEYSWRILREHVPADDVDELDGAE